jgi:hypothetical protein
VGGSNTVAMFGRVIQMSAVLACAGAACGGGQLGGDPPTGGSGGIMTSGGGATGQGGDAGSGGVPPISSGCIFNDPGTPVPYVEVFDPGPVAVACQGLAQSGVVIRIGDQSGQGFDWRASVSSPGVFWPSISEGSACPGFTPQDVGVDVAFPDDAAAGSRASGTLVIDTTYRGLPRIEEPVNAILVPVQFMLELLGSATAVPPGTASDPLVVDFGSVVGDVYVQVRNLGTAPLALLHPASPLPDPFWFQDWGYHGEDPPPTLPVAPGEVARMIVGFHPSTPGSYSADLELTPFRTTPGAGCGSPVHVLLKANNLPTP